MSKDYFKVTTKVVRLWLHECERVFRDRMVSDTDIEKYDEFVTATLKTAFKEEPLDQVTASPNLFSSFMDFTADDTPVYNQVPLAVSCRVLLHISIVVALVSFMLYLCDHNTPGTCCEGSIVSRKAHD